MNDSKKLIDSLVQDSVLRVGKVVEVHGRTVKVEVDKEKNLSDLLFDGDIIKNISVDSYIEIRKGFLNLIGKVDGEEIKEDPAYARSAPEQVIKITRLLTVSLVGYIGSDKRFEGGTKELPLIGNEAFIVSAEKIKIIHQLVEDSELCITVAETDDGIDIPFPVDGLFNGHIAIFGNTGSGKSNTLAHLYQEFIGTLRDKCPCTIENRTRFLLLDFNGEYDEYSISETKRIYKLSTGSKSGERIPFREDDLLDIEMLSILCDATEKTQKPFLSRAVGRFKKYVLESNNRTAYFRGILERQIKDIFGRSDKTTVDALLGFMTELLRTTDEMDPAFDPLSDIKWFKDTYKLRDESTYFDSSPDAIMQTQIYKQIMRFQCSDDTADSFVAYAYIQLIDDGLADFSHAEFVVPAIRRLKRRSASLCKVIKLVGF